jgi:hypothetical protein
VEVTARGYLSEEKNVWVEAGPGPGPAHLFEQPDQHPARFVLELYAEPRPTVELVVPTGYRGVVKAEVQIEAEMACPPGQRRFRYEVPESGVVRVSGPPLLRRALSTQFQAEYADGTSLKRNAPFPDVGFWWLKGDETTQIFVVGTQYEYEDYRRAYQQESGKNRSTSSGGNEDGHGRRGRRGRQSSGDSNPAGGLP